MRLDELPLQQKAIIEIVQPSENSDRLQDLGFVPGTEISCLLHGPLKNPRMYRLLETNIALRNEDAATIFVRCESQ